MKLTLQKERVKLIAQEMNDATKLDGCREVIISIDEAENSFTITIQPVIDPVKIVCTIYEAPKED